MNKLVAGIVLGLALGSGATWLLLHHPAAGEPAKAEAAAKPEEKPNPLRVPPAKRTAAGITLAKPAAATLAPEVQGFARVLDATALATVVSELETARAALAASEKELARAQKLFAAGGNASAQAVEAAEAAAARDRSALASAQARLAAGWGRAIAQNPAAVTAALGRGAALVRIDLLPGDTPAPDAKQARLNRPGTTENFAAEIIGPAPLADAQVQGTSFLALLPQPLAAGATLRATLPGVGESATVFVVPRTAVVYHQGSAWIYVLGEEDTFERKLVSVGRNVGADAVALLSGAEPDEQIATTGAQQLLAAELQAGGAAEP